MLIGTGEYRGGKSGGYARVHVRCDDNTRELRVDLSLDEHQWNDQLRDGSFTDWTDAAIAGARFALDVSDRTTGLWTIHRVVGLVVDTVPRFMVIAAARSVWDALNVEQTTSLDDNLVEFVDEHFPT